VRQLVLLLGVLVRLVGNVTMALAANGPGLNSGSEYEELVAQPVGFGDQGSITITNVDCNPGGISTFDVAASGTAYGPYPGTFEETATVTIGPSGELQSFDAAFTIHSGATTITGTKRLYPDDPERYSSGLCSGTYSPDPGSCDSAQQLFASTRYEASVGDAFMESGIATV
jgi:hypothetical protein